MKLRLLAGLLAANLASGSLIAEAPKASFDKAPKDIALANKERIVYWLTKRGDLPSDASAEQQEQAYRAYLGRAIAANKQSQLPTMVQKQSLATHQKVLSGAHKHHKEAADKTVKVLTVLVDFQDLKYNANGLTSNDTQMYYSDYNVKHYNDLMFSTSGYAGPSGQNFVSGNQYFTNVSGGTFNFTGDVFGWVTADNNAAHYGGNDADNNDKDKNPTELIKEAVTKAVQANNIDLADYDIEDPYDLNGNGNLDEPDGIIDHVSIFHSSIGEEAGGGKLGEDAIWSHRFFVDGQQGGYQIPGTNKKLFGYVIQPIDAAAGVVVHEFGHDLGLPDLYDTNGNSADSNASGSPVGFWSVMSAGSWVGSIAGTEPVGFDPYSRAYLQAKYGGNWVSETSYTLEELQTAVELDLVQAENHSAVNQIKVELPRPLLDFTAPYAGDYQYYSDQGHLMNNSMQFDLSLPASSSLELSMKAHWDIEVDYDYVQLLVNGMPIAGNHTKPTNLYHSSVTNFITDKSKNIVGAEGELGWVDLTFDLTAYAGQDVTVTIQYVTDPAVGGYGFVADEIKVTNSGTEIYSDGAEVADQAQLNGFLRSASQRPGKEQLYWIQLRAATAQDGGFENTIYSPGVLVWFADFNVADNNSSEHPGTGLVGVVDADQGVINRNASVASTSSLIRDAAFGLLNQKATSGDNDLTPKPLFKDSNDYSFATQAESGIILPKHGVEMQVLEQAANSHTAKIKLSSPSLVLAADFTADINFRSVSFTDATSGGQAGYRYDWDFGDDSAHSTEASPKHEYSASGDYTVTLTVTDQEGTSHSSQKQVSIAEALVVDFTESVSGDTVSVTANVSGGVNPSISWNFGDGNSATASDTSHAYALTGQYTVTLTVTSEDQQSQASSKQVAVVVPLNADFTNSTNNLSANFTSAISGGDGNYTYAWDFGDGATSSSANPSHSYSTAGSYTVELLVTEGTGVEQKVSKTVTVNAAPTPPPAQSSGGGGSANLLLILLLSLVGFRKRLK